MSVNSKMTALADEIRILSGTEDTMGLDAMKTNVNQANSNVETEADLIAQIQTALESKAAGSGGTSVETCSLIVEGATSDYYPVNIAYMTVDDSGNVVSVHETVSTSSVTVTCLRGSVVSVKYKSAFNGFNFSIGSNMVRVTPLFSDGYAAVYKIADDAETAFITNESSNITGSND